MGGGPDTMIDQHLEAIARSGPQRYEESSRIGRPLDGPEMPFMVGY